MSLRIGHIDYLNCVPFFHHFSVSDTGDSIVTGTPAELNAMLARGKSIFARPLPLNTVNAGPIIFYCPIFPSVLSVR